MSLVSLVDGERQFFKSQQGLPAPWDTVRATPLTHSFCQYVVGSGAPLAVEDAREHGLLRHNLAVPHLGVISYLGVPLRDPDGHVLGSFCVISDEPRAWTEDDEAVLVDIAEQLRAELRLRAALDEVADDARFRRDLLAMLAHDVRSPAAMVESTVATLRRLPADSELAASLLDAVERQAGRIVRLSEALLGRAEGAGGVEPVDLRGLVEAAVGGSTGRARVDADLDDVVVDLDRTAAEQILANLVDNALKHTDGRVAVRARRDGDAVRLVVRDEGPGVPREELEDLFQPFHRGQTSARGHGLGLHIVGTLVRALDGTIECDSGPDRGTEITVVLPPLRERGPRSAT